MNIETVINRFNRGEVDPDAIARFDVETAADSCALMENFTPIRLGPMAYRPGFIYKGEARAGAGNRALIPLTRSVENTVLFEFADGLVRPLDGGVPVAVSPSSTSFTNEDFSTGLGWTSGGFVAFNVGSVDLYSNDAYIHQTSGAVTAGITQTFRVVVSYGACVIQIGNGATVGGADVHEQTLSQGTHIIQFTPGSTTFSITLTPAYRFLGDGNLRARVDHCGGVSTGFIELPVPNVDYRKVSYDVSADVMFLALGKDHPPKVLKRFGSADVGVSGCSYSVEEYLHVRGPYGPINTSETSVYAVSYDSFSDVHSSDGAFSSADDQGRLIKIVFPEQLTLASFTAVGQTTSFVEVLGEGDDRELLIRITGATATNRVSLQRYNPQTGGADVIARYSADTSEIVSDKFDGERRRYLLACDAYSAGTLTAEIQYVSRSVHGHGAIVSISSEFLATAYVYDVFPLITSANPTVYWYKGAWGPGTYPQGVTLYEGRLCWASQNRVDMTVTDDYYSFDTEQTGDSAAISRTIGFGAVENISWLESGGRLFLGLPTTEVLIRSTNFDEPLTPLNTNLKPGKGVGSAPVRAVADENNINFVSRDSTRIHSLSHTVADDRQVAEDLMLLHPSICLAGVESMALSKSPESRLWVVTADGELRVLLTDPTENIRAWSRVVTQGEVIDVAVEPNLEEDRVWILVSRDNGTFVEQLHSFSDYIPEDRTYPQLYPMDSSVRYVVPGSATITGLDHLEGQVVGVWADGQDRGDLTVTSGQVTLDSATYTEVVIGLRYTSRYQSNKLTDYTTDSVFTRRKTVQNAALVLRNYVPSAVTVGRDFDNMVGLPNQAAGPMVVGVHTEPFGFNGASGVDPRVCIKATGPCKIMALAYQVDQSDGQK